MNADSAHWAQYYEVTVDRPAWETVRRAIELFAVEDGDDARERFAVDLGCGAGRDARELLRAGWRVLAVDREAAGVETLAARVDGDGDAAGRLQTLVADLATVDVPPCDLVNASLSLPFLVRDDFWAAWGRVLAALPVGGRVSAMVFGDRDGSADDPSMTCVNPAALRESLAAFEIEHWVDREEDSTTALGEPHHFHRLELVARRVRAAGV